MTISAGTDYTLANASITNPYYSYEANPQGYPGYFNFAPSTSGWSSSIRSSARFFIVGTMCTLQIDLVGVSNSTSFSFTAPVAAADSFIAGLLGGTDNSSDLASPSYASMSATATVTLNKAFNSANWTNSNNKGVRGGFSYRF